MAFRINTNIASLNAQRQLSGSQTAINKSLAQMSSGSRIKTAADDAAGLSISENLKSRISGFRQAQRNAQDAVSVIQVAEGGLNEITNILSRFRELGVQAASDTVGIREREFINKEVQQLKNEADRIAHVTKWGSTKLLSGEGDQFDFQIDLGNNDFEDRISFNSADIEATTQRLGISDFNFSTKEGARDSMTTIDDAMGLVNEYRSNLGALQNRLLSTSNNLGTSVENMSDANSRVRDTDLAEASSELVRNNILLNASTAVLAQANQVPQAAMRLLQ